MNNKDTEIENVLAPRVDSRRNPAFSATLASIGKRLADQDLAVLAEHLPAAAYVRSLTTDVARSSTEAVIALAASILAPQIVPPSSGRGRKGNAGQRFELASQLPWNELRPERLGELRAELLRRQYSVNTINKTLASVRGVLTQYWKFGKLDIETLERMKLALEGVRGSTVPKGRHIPRVELDGLLQQCELDQTPAGARDALIICLLAAGMRRAEVAGVRVTDIDLKAGRILVRGKGNKERETFLRGGGLVALQAWLGVRGLDEGALLFPVTNGGDLVVREGLTAQAIYKILLKRASQAGVEVRPHDLRRTLIGEAFTAGFDVSTIQQLVGHASPATTSRYDRRTDEYKKLLFERLALEFKLRSGGGT